MKLSTIAPLGGAVDSDNWAADPDVIRADLHAVNVRRSRLRSPAARARVIQEAQALSRSLTSSVDILTSLAQKETLHCLEPLDARERKRLSGLVLLHCTNWDRMESLFHEDGFSEVQRGVQGDQDLPHWGGRKKRLLRDPDESPRAPAVEDARTARRHQLRVKGANRVIWVSPMHPDDDCYKNEDIVHRLGMLWPPLTQIVVLKFSPEDYDGIYVPTIFDALRPEKGRYLPDWLCHPTPRDRNHTRNLCTGRKDLPELLLKLSTRRGPTSATGVDWASCEIEPLALYTGRPYISGLRPTP